MQVLKANTSQKWLCNFTEKNTCAESLHAKIWSLQHKLAPSHWSWSNTQRENHYMLLLSSVSSFGTCCCPALPNTELGRSLVWACIVLLAIGTDSSRREFYSYTSTPSFPPFIVLTDRHVLPHIIVLKQWTETVLKPQAWMLLTNYSWLARTWCAEYRYFVFRTHKHW